MVLHREGVGVIQGRLRHYRSKRYQSVEGGDRLRIPIEGGRTGRRGVDNIDIEAATEAGVIVMNTPGGIPLRLPNLLLLT